MIIYKVECHKCGIVKEFHDERLADSYTCDCNYEQPLLTIELQDESSVPKVIYKGKEITNRVNVFFDWDTADAHGPGGLSYAIEHIETGSEQVTTNRIERRCRDHA